MTDNRSATINDEDWMYTLKGSRALMRPCDDLRCNDCIDNYKVCKTCMEGFEPSISGRCVLNPYHGVTNDCSEGYFWDASNNKCTAC